MVAQMRALSLCALAAAGLSLSGCVLGAVDDVVTAPFKVGGKAVDLATTSQSEADEKRGREIRRREEKLGKLERQYSSELRKCRKGVRRACDAAQLTYREIQDTLPTVPAETGPADPEDND